MIYQIPYNISEFNGKLIDRQTFLDLKQAFKLNPYLDFPAPKSYLQEYKNEAFTIIIPFLICVFLMPFGDVVEGTFVMIILAISFITLSISAISQSSQFFSFQKARKKQKTFFVNLKRDIVASENYLTFVNFQNKRK